MLLYNMQVQNKISPMTATRNSFFAVRIDFGERVSNTQFEDKRTALMVLQQARAQYGYDNATMVEVHF